MIFWQASSWVVLLTKTTLAINSLSKKDEDIVNQSNLSNKKKLNSIEIFQSQQCVFTDLDYCYKKLKYILFTQFSHPKLAI